MKTIDERSFYTVQELQQVFQIGRNNAYKMVNTKGFPAIRIGRRIVIPVDKLQEWAKHNAKGVDVIGQ